MTRSFVILLILCLPQMAQAYDCEFVPRAEREVKEMLSEMPKTVTGWATCHEKYPQLSIFVTAKLEKFTDRELKIYLQRYARLMVYSGTTSSFLSYKVLPSGARQALYETKRINGMDPTQHFVFTLPQKDGSQIVFVHSLGAKETTEQMETLEELRLLLTGPKFLSQMRERE